jgi:hypothetical protein
MRREFDQGYRVPYRRLVTSYPDEAVYPADSFRVEWGPMMMSVARGCLDLSFREGRLVPIGHSDLVGTP